MSFFKLKVFIEYYEWRRGAKVMWEDFKEFAFQGNVLDLAVAVVIGAAFGQIVTSLVENIIMPLVGGLLNGVNFEGLSYFIGDSEIQYGIFIQSVFNFFVIAGSIFLFVRLIMQFRKEEEVEEEEEEEEELELQEQLLTEIRDLLEKQK